MSSWQCPPKEDSESLVNFACPMLNELLSPAFRRRNVIELCGEAGAAKTQFCLHLALQTLLKGSGYVLCIVTERAFASKRMLQMIKYNGLDEDLLDRIIVKTAWESSEFFPLIEHTILDVSKVLQLDLIIVDSVAGPLRSEFESGQKRERAREIHKMGFHLNKISRKLNIPVLVTNQVTAVISQKQTNFGRDVVPCFGLSWTCYVHSRIFLLRTGLTIKSDNLPVTRNNVDIRIREAIIDFSPVLPNSVVKFIVDDAGVRGLKIKD